MQPRQALEQMQKVSLAVDSLSGQNPANAQQAEGAGEEIVKVIGKAVNISGQVLTPDREMSPQRRDLMEACQILKETTVTLEQSIVWFNKGAHK
jgi:hypothetical protein